MERINFYYNVYSTDQYRNLKVSVFFLHANVNLNKYHSFFNQACNHIPNLGRAKFWI